MPVNVWRVDLDPRSPVPLYQQIADLLRADIERGTYAPGDVIPSIERIHQETGVTVVTIRRGIKLLADEGLVVIVPGKGTFVAQREER